MKRYFITATGTDIGKTLVTSALAWQLRARGLRVSAIKPIISGFNELQPADSDSAQLLAAQGLPLTGLDSISPWRYAAPLSPDMAAKLENRSFALSDIVGFCNNAQECDAQLIEGVGGVMAPLTNNETMLDWMALQAIPVILVAGSYVGTLSHTLTALKVLESHQLQVQRIIISESAASAATLAQTAESLARHTACAITLMQRLDSQPEIWKNAPNLTEGLL